MCLYSKNGCVNSTEIFGKHISQRVLLAIKFLSENIESWDFMNGPIYAKIVIFHILWSIKAFDWNK